MIHDLELTTVVDAQGVLTPVFSDKDNKILDFSISIVELNLHYALEQYFDRTITLSGKLATIDVMRRLNHPELSNYVKKLQDEL
jgi:hypothetical protein